VRWASAGARRLPRRADDVGVRGVTLSEQHEDAVRPSGAGDGSRSASRVRELDVLTVLVEPGAARRWRLRSARRAVESEIVRYPSSVGGGSSRPARCRRPSSRRNG
jgi:hypothetical protein